MPSSVEVYLLIDENKTVVNSVLWDGVSEYTTEYTLKKFADAVKDVDYIDGGGFIAEETE